MKIISPTLCGARTILNCALRAAVDTTHALRAVFFYPLWLAVFQSDGVNRAYARAEPTAVASVVHGEHLCRASKGVEDRANKRCFDARARDCMHILYERMSKNCFRNRCKFRPRRIDLLLLQLRAVHVESDDIVIWHGN